LFSLSSLRKREFTVDGPVAFAIPWSAIRRLLAGKAARRGQTEFFDV
jgi:hypothetical protein